MSNSKHEIYGMRRLTAPFFNRGNLGRLDAADPLDGICLPGDTRGSLRLNFDQSLGHGVFALARVVMLLEIAVEVGPGSSTSL